MADFYPVLKRAIASLPSNSGESRRIVYEKARAALLKQLQSYNPPLSPSDITEQRLALEECIRRVEGEVAGAAFGLVPTADPADIPTAAPPKPTGVPQPARPPEPAPPKPVTPPPPPPPKPAAPPPPPPKPVAPPPPPPAPAPEPPLAPTEPAAKPDPRPEPPMARPPAEAVVVPPPTVPMPKPPPAAPVRAESRDEPPPRPDPGADARLGAGMSALAKTLRSAENLGGASAEALRNARGAIEDDPPPRAEPERVEPDFLQRPLGLDAGADGPVPELQPEPAAERPRRKEKPAKPVKEKPVRAAAPPRAEPSQARLGRRGSLLLLAIVLAVVIGAGVGIWQRESLLALIRGAPAPEAVPTEVAAPATDPTGLEPKILDRLPQDGEPASPVAPDAVTVTTEPVAPVVGEEMPADPSGGADVAVAPGDGPSPLALAPTEAPAAPTLAPEPTPTAEATPTPEPTATPTPLPETPAVAEPLPTATPAPTDGPAVLVAQRAILYEEPVPGSEGARVEGRVLWTFVNEPVLPGEPPQPQARAVVEVPDRGITLSVSIRRNADPALPASHIVQMTFGLPPDFAGRSIDTTPGLILKETEDARGDPLIGAVAKVSDNLFWLALSGTPQENERNIALLRERPWFDVPIRYGNRRRAILTFEKGSPGDQVMAEAFAAWGN